MNKEKQKDEIDKIDIILYKSYESDIGIGKENYNYIISFIKSQQKEIEKLNFENHMLKKWNEQLDKNCISKDKIREKLEIERIKALDRFDNKLDVKQRIYKRNIQVAMLDTLSKELLKEN